MKKILSLLFALAFAATASAQVATSQQPGVYSSVLNGGTNNVLAATTNVYSVQLTNAYPLYTNVFLNPTITMACAEHPSFGMEVSYSCASASATNANLIVLGYQSFDNGNSYETVPSLVFTNALPTAIQQGAATGFTNRNACFNVSAPNATHVGFQIGNTHATLNYTNINVVFNLNNTRTYSEPARR